jgi:hypothetical protein
MSLSLSRLSALAAALLLSACATGPITSQTIAGRYEYEHRPQGYGGETIVLGEGTFEYTVHAPDIAANVERLRYPIRGSYKLDGSTITFLSPAVANPERTLTRQNNRFVLWTQDQLDDYRQTGRRPDDLLYQQR